MPADTWQKMFTPPSAGLFIALRSGDSHLYMRSLLALGALLLSASPAFADDYLYLRCKFSVDWVQRNSITSKITEDRTFDDIALLKVDFQRKTVLDTRSEGPLDIAIQGKTLIVTQKIEEKEFKLEDEGRIESTPPYAMSGKGSGIFKAKNQMATYSYEGLCEEIDASVFEEALKEARS